MGVQIVHLSKRLNGLLQPHQAAAKYHPHAKLKEVILVWSTAC